MADASEPREDSALPTADPAAPVDDDDGAGAEALPAETRPADDAQPPRRLAKPRPGTVVAAGAIVTIGALLAASGYIAVHHRAVVQDRQRAAAFTAAAKQGVINMTSLDFQHAEDDIQRVLDNATGEFKDDFARQAADFISVSKQAHVTSNGAVNAAAVESMDRDSAVVLVSATSFVTNSAGAKDDPRTWRLRVTVTKDGDQIKMSKLMYVP